MNMYLHDLEVSKNSDDFWIALRIICVQHTSPGKSRQFSLAKAEFADFAVSFSFWYPFFADFIVVRIWKDAAFFIRSR